MRRLMLGIEKYRRKEASLEKAAEVAELPLIEMIIKLADYGIKSNLTDEDVQEGLKNLRKAW